MRYAGQYRGPAVRAVVLADRHAYEDLGLLVAPCREKPGRDLVAPSAHQAEVLATVTHDIST
jgi:hypothetical protein